MILEKGDMFSMWGKTDLFLFTSNPIVNKRGLAVMGRGIAKQLADRYPDVPVAFGNKLRSFTEDPDTWQCDEIGSFDGQRVGFFMVKDHWSNTARLDIIQQSAEDLIQWIEETDDPLERVDLNFPGIGNGRLNREDVLPLIERLPDNVHVWEYVT